MVAQQEMTKEFQPLFELMLDEHNLILTISEMEDIIIAVQKFLKQNKKQKKQKNENLRTIKKGKGIFSFGS